VNKMTGKETFQIWAPAGKKWVDWVRPVPFVEMNEHSKNYNLAIFEVPAIDFLHEKFSDAAIIVDLPGAESVMEGLALAKLGYRPIPIFNGTIEQSGARATVDNQTVGVALEWGANILEGINIPEDAPPAFLTDSNRLHRFKMDVTMFDNSWDVYPQDIPSADYMLSNGINKIIIVSDKFSRDLKKVLYSYQKKKIEIYVTQGYEEPKKVRIPRKFSKDKD